MNRTQFEAQNAADMQEALDITLGRIPHPMNEGGRLSYLKAEGIERTATSLLVAKHYVRTCVEISATNPTPGDVCVYIHAAFEDTRYFPVKDQPLMVLQKRRNKEEYFWRKDLPPELRETMAKNEFFFMHPRDMERARLYAYNLFYHAGTGMKYAKAWRLTEEHPAWSCGESWWR